MKIVIRLLLLLACSLPAYSQDGLSWKSWNLHSESIQSVAGLASDPGREYVLGEQFSSRWPGVWLQTEVVIPAIIKSSKREEKVSGKPVGLKINSDCGGEIYVDGKLQMRYDNDHAGMAFLTKAAKVGDRYKIAVRIFPDVSDENRKQTLGLASLEILDPSRVVKHLAVDISATNTKGPLPRRFNGMSQGAGMADYNDETAKRFRDMGVKWFRMDNILTNAVKRLPDGSLSYDWSDLDKRLKFMEKIGCQFVFCVSYMPEALEAFPNPDRHAPPKDFAEWEELCYQAARYTVESGRPVKYWEIWNEANSGWLKAYPGMEPLETYLKLYDASWKGIRRAIPDAWIGGPCNASGPWDTSPERGYAVNGEKYMRGLLEHCEKTGAPLDFISWHEYFHPPTIFREEADVTRQYMRDYPKAAAGVKEFFVTEWSYAWWHDWPHDNEVGAAWAVNSILRGIIPGRIDKVFYFFAKDFEGDGKFRGSWGMLMAPDVPKAVYNAAKMMNMMAPVELAANVDDPEIAVQASLDPATGRVTVLVLNYAEIFGVERVIDLRLHNLPANLRGGTVKRWVIDKETSNAFHNRNSAELTFTRTDQIPDSAIFRGPLTAPANSITLLEMLPDGS